MRGSYRKYPLTPLIEQWRQKHDDSVALGAGARVGDI